MPRPKKLPSGRWRVQIQYRGKRRSITAATYDEAVDAGIALHNEMRGIIADDRPTVGQLVDRRIAVADWAPKTLDSYQRARDRLGRLSSVRADRLTVVDVEDRYADLVADGIDANSIRHLHSLLSQAMKEGIRIGAISVSPMPVVRAPRVRRKPITVPTPAQVRAILAHADPVARMAIALAATTGMREGEVVGLQWPKVDVEGRTLMIDRALGYTPAAGLYETETKTGEAGHRRIVIDADLADDLRAHRIASGETALALGLTPGPNVISDDGGRTPWRPDRLGREYREARDAAGVTGVRFHDLRHFAATQQLAAGEPVSVVAYRLGHTDERTTTRVYGHWIPGRDAGAAEVMRRVLRG